MDIDPVIEFAKHQYGTIGKWLWKHREKIKEWFVFRWNPKKRLKEKDERIHLLETELKNKSLEKDRAEALAEIEKKRTEAFDRYKENAKKVQENLTESIENLNRPPTQYCKNRHPMVAVGTEPYEPDMPGLDWDCEYTIYKCTQEGCYWYSNPIQMKTQGVTAALP